MSEVSRCEGAEANRGPGEVGRGRKIREGVYEGWPAEKSFIPLL